MWWLAAACFVVAAFLFFCVPFTGTNLVGIGSRYGCPRMDRYGVACRRAACCGQHFKIPVGHGCTVVVHSRNRRSFPGPWFLKVDWAAVGVWYWVIWQEPRCWGLPERFGVAPLLEDIVELVFLEYPLSVIRGLVHSLPCSRVAQIGRNTVRTWISLRKNRMVDDKKDLRPKPRNGSSGARRGRSGGRRDSGWRNRGRGSTRSSSSSPSWRKRRGTQQKIKEAQKLLEKLDPKYQKWKELAKKKERAVELQEQAEVLAKVMKEQFDHTINALSPALISSPPFPPSPPRIPSLPLAVEERREQNDLLGAPQLRWIEAELLHKVSFVRNGVTRDESIQTLGEQFGDRRVVAALAEFITRHGGGAAIPRAKEARSGLVFDIARKQ